MSRVAILQSNYLPWRGYFDMIAKVDEFIVYDSCQYTVNDWRNRNQVKGRDGLIWLTVPVLTKGRTGQLITDAAFAETNWATKHLSTVRQTLGRAPHFDTIDELLSRTLETSIGTERLHQVNVALLRALAGALQLDTRLTLDSDYGELDGERSARVAELAGRAGATSYLTGPRGLDYLDPAPFDERGIALEVIDYSTLAPYPQLFGEFAPAVSVIDLLANCGPESPAQLTSVVRRVERAGEQLLPGDVLATDGGSP